ncbi:amidohydrolase [Kordiimonas marina]|uniref:amidohydrolase n=1 Tax=Kordiimonas marina TaxID=2872312 RepID=UPI001FF54709|nr:amidohydrolase [Kordiimonas marina]MCJ9427460.1 amidohydrolase [Kordiimonas marina]
MKKFLMGCSAALMMTAAASVGAHADDTLMKAIDGDYPYLKSLYVHLHETPELSLHEKNTSARIAKELREVGFDVTDHFGGYGVVGVMKNGDGPTILIRTDMDALPVTEETGLPYASKVTTKDDGGNTVGVMHACGHDIHMTSFVGTARRLAAMKDKWRGTLVMIGQPAEERVKGAEAMLDAGLFTKFPRPDYNLALHDSPALKAGEIGMTPGYALANVDSVDIEIHGIGGHGAYPHTTKDPVVLGSYIVVALQTLVSRETSPLQPAVVTVGSFHAGTKHNIISDHAHLQLTVRSYDDKVRTNLLAGIKRIARGEAIAFGLPEKLMPEVTFSEPTPSTYNDPALTEKIFGALSAKMGKDHVHKIDPVMGAEDFALYGRTDPKIPSLIFWLGALKPADVDAAKAGKLKLPSLHSPFFAPEPDKTIRGGVEAMTTAALTLLAKP